jgi:hypothetical protein
MGKDKIAEIVAYAFLVSESLREESDPNLVKLGGVIDSLLEVISSEVALEEDAVINHMVTLSKIASSVHIIKSTALN